jgi:hypothetical protein
MPSFASKAIAATSRGLEVALKVALRTPRRRRLPALAGARRLGDRALPGWLPLQWPPMQPPKAEAATWLHYFVPQNAHEQACSRR